MLRAPRTRIALIALAVYAAALALIAFWPVPVDSGAGPLLALITEVFPPLTHPRVEFAANILLFVPLGVLLSLIDRRATLPIAFATTVVIECVQAVALAARTPSLLDVLANLLGAGIGLLVVVAVDRHRHRRTDRADPLTR
ncbi:VanZ family protein [Microbacterium dauci]|uniref:VanZ family protein n=1 Tax=Microbacterium dauci TaxID=3048008 RepID=A0ABT6ZFH5_9MICO|nr:VanZ family protein [Microbacterium sp. LX3-4]MDJ1114480.1 VanZ family protein [Microbacterium sp. LX3-4]